MRQMLANKLQKCMCPSLINYTCENLYLCVICWVQSLGWQMSPAFQSTSS